MEVTGLINLSSHISKEIGIYFTPEQSKQLEKKLLPALPELGFKSLQECVDTLIKAKFTKSQVDTLAKYLTIGETYFFRDKNIFAMLKDVVFPEIIKNHELDRTIRIWSAAAATGEEAYSLAILISEVLPKNEFWNVRIIGTDINPLFLKKAREARYKAWSFRALPKETFEHYFKKEDKGEVSVIPSIRSMVKFTQLNLIDGAYAQFNPELKNLDLILCNNVLLYFAPAEIKATVKNLVHTIAKDGWLYVSSVEVPYIHDTELTPIIGHKTTVFRKYKPEIPKKKEVVEKALENEPPQKKPLSEKEFYECCHSMYRSGFYAEVINQLTHALSANQYQTPSIKKKLKEVKLLINALLNQGKFETAKKWCETGLGSDKLDKELHYLHATILQEIGDQDKASEELRKALFIDPNMVAAHFLSGILSLKKKDQMSAMKQFDNAIELLKKVGPEESIPGMENITAGELAGVTMQMRKEIDNGQ